MAKNCTDCGVVVDSLKGTYNMWLLRNRDAEGNPIEVAEQSRSVEPETDNQGTDNNKEVSANVFDGMENSAAYYIAAMPKDTQSEPNEKQAEIDALTAQLETVTDKKERTKIKNRIQYLKRP